jgi:hypothetical protein
MGSYFQIGESRFLQEGNKFIFDDLLKHCTTQDEKGLVLTIVLFNPIF